MKGVGGFFLLLVVTISAFDDCVQPHQRIINPWLDRDTVVSLDSAIQSVLSQLQNESWASLVIASTPTSLHTLVGTTSEKGCHYHPTEFRATVLRGSYYFRVPTSKEQLVLNPGDEMILPAGTPHSEGVYCTDTDPCPAAILRVTWSPLPGNENTIPLDNSQCDSLKLTQPSLAPCPNQTLPLLPSTWSATVLVHPFSKVTPVSDSMYTHLNIVQVSYSPKEFVIRALTCQTNEIHLYRVLADSTTEKSLDGGKTWKSVYTNWSFPTGNVFGEIYNCAGTSPVNWMSENSVEWWRTKVPDTEYNGTWWWFNTSTRYPFRVMFGSPPPSPTVGAFNQLAFFQMFSFSYFTNFSDQPLDLLNMEAPSIPGFQCTNSSKLFEWNTHFGMTTFMVPVNYNNNPLPTTVFYNWGQTPPEFPSSRVQITDMWYDFNPDNTIYRDTAILFNNPNLEQPGFEVKWFRNGSLICLFDLPFPQQMPWWPRMGNGEVNGIISPNGEYSPLTGSTIPTHVIVVEFPPYEPQYPDETDLWTWYAQNPNEDKMRPVTFMQSASGIGVGTSLALADYYDYAEYPAVINTTIPWMYLYEYCIANFPQTPQN